MTTATAKLNVTRKQIQFRSDDRRVITRFFWPGSRERAQRIVERVQGLTDQQVADQLDAVHRDFRSRHRDIDAIIALHYDEACRNFGNTPTTDRPRSLLIGSYFTLEYAIESAALFNPSMVLHPNQDDLPRGAVRFLMSLRATGEGHISSIVFRTGIVRKNLSLEFDDPSPYVRRARAIADKQYHKKLFRLKLQEMGAISELTDMILDRVNEYFTLSDLEAAIATVQRMKSIRDVAEPTAKEMLWLARSNYHLELPRDADPSEIVIFPSSENETKGIEDARLVRFIDEDGSVVYFGTYTAYNGFRILPQIMETADFATMKIHTLNGRYVQNKGMALFPRKINGRYMMVGRIDGENMFLMQSDDVHFWNEAKLLVGPKYPWEFVQVGNCGSPLETERGWLLLTHGVGPMREYCIGAVLLDLDDPSRIIGQLEQPLLMPNENERDGYVPNVVYSCGGIIHENQLILPYAMSDIATTFATVDVNELIDAMTPVAAPAEPAAAPVDN